MQPPPPPAPPAPPAPGTPAADVAPIAVPGSGAPEAVLRAAQAQRRELVNQLERLERRHDEIARELRETPMSEAAIRKGMETRLGEMEQRIADVERQISAAEAQVARAAGIPGAVQPDRPPQRNGPPEELFIIPVVFIMFVLFPLTIAYARRIWRRGTAAVAAVPSELMERMTRLETAVDTVSVEVERIGEGQRFVSRLFAEGGARHLGAIPAPAVEAPAPARDAVPVGAASDGR